MIQLLVSIIEPKDTALVPGWRHWLFIRSTSVLSVAMLAQVFTVLAALWTEESSSVGLGAGEFMGFVAIVVLLSVQIIGPEERALLVHALRKLRLGALKRVYFRELEKKSEDVEAAKKDLTAELSKLKGWKAKRDAVRLRIERLLDLEK